MGRRKMRGSGEERRAQMEERRKKKEEKLRSKHGSGMSAREAETRERAAREEAAAAAARAKVADSTEVLLCAVPRTTRAMLAVFVAVAVYSAVSACDKAVPADFVPLPGAPMPPCSPFARFADVSVAAAAAAAVVLLLGSHTPAVLGFFVAWLAVPVLFLAALPTLLALIALLFGADGIVDVADTAHSVLAHPPALVLPYLHFAVLASAVYTTRHYLAILLYSTMSTFSPTARRFHIVYQISTGPALFTLWFFAFRPAPAATDVVSWPGVGTLLLCSAAVAVPATLWLAAAVRSFYGPVYWSSYGTAGVVFRHHAGPHTAEPVLLLSRTAIAELATA